MNRAFATIALLGLIFSACVPQEVPPEKEEEKEEERVVTASVTTGMATDVEPTSAKLNGTCAIVNAKDANGGAYFYYSKTSASSAEIAKNGIKTESVSVSNSGGAFNVTVADIEPSTSYYFVAAVSIDKNEFLGEVSTFTTKEKPKELTVTGGTDQITEISAVLIGYANPTPELGNVTIGILLSRDENPSLDNSQKLLSQELNGNNQYTVKANGLASDTNYYYKSFIEYGGVYRSGEVKSFRTLEIKPEFLTCQPTEVGMYKATLNGSLRVETKADLSREVWFLYEKGSLSLDELKAKGHKKIANLSESGSFSYQLEGLESNETYSYVSCSKIHDKEFIADVVSFTTDDIRATVTALDATEVGLFSATIEGTLTVDNQESLYTRVWFLYGTDSSLDGLKQNGKKVDATLDSDGHFAVGLKNLNYNTDYHFVACAKVKDREFFSEVKGFTTGNITVTTGDATDITLFKATLSGHIVIDSMDDLSNLSFYTYILYGPCDTLEELMSNGVLCLAYFKTEEEFLCSLTGLKGGTKYKYLACVKVNDTWVYAQQMREFETRSITVTTYDATEVGIYAATISGNLTIEQTSDYLQSRNTYLLYGTDNTVEGLMTNGKKSAIKRNDDGDFTQRITNLSRNTKYYFMAYATISMSDYYYLGEIKEFTTGCDQDYGEAVDMGLSVKWRSCNLGARCAEDYGAYYAWGETENKAYFSYGNYKFSKSSSGPYTKYCADERHGDFIDNLTRLESEDDAAQAMLGGTWRMPTIEEWRELKNNCQTMWTTLNDVTGCLVTSKVNGNSIFIPASGESDASPYNVGEMAHLWSSSLYTWDSSYAQSVYFNSRGCNFNNMLRFYGFAIRPVMD